MSSIGSDNTYRDFSSRINELEDELKTAAKRARQKQGEEIDHLRKAQSETLRKQERDYSRTIARTKEHGDNALTRERELTQADAAQRKREIYDRYGRVRTGELEGMQQELASAREDYSRQKQAEMKRTRDLENHHEKRSDDLQNKGRRELEKAVSQVQQESRNAIAASSQDRHGDVKDSRGELEAQYQDLSRRLLEDHRKEKARISENIDTLEENYDTRADASEKAMRARVDALNAEYQKKAEGIASRLRDSHAGETKNYRDQIHDLAGFKKEFDEASGDGRAKAYREVENDFRMRGKVADEQYRRELDNQKGKDSNTEAHFSRLHNEALRDKDRYFARVISDQLLESHNQQKDSAAIFENGLKQSNLRNTQDRKQANQAMENQARNLREGFAENIEQFSRTQREGAVRKTAQTDSEIKHLKGKLNHLKTTHRPADISPGAADSLRKTVAGEYQESLDAEVKRNADRADHKSAENQKVLHGSLAEHQTIRTESERRNAAERQIEKSELLQTISDTQSIRDTQLREREGTHQRELEKQEKHFISTMDLQRRGYEELLQASSHDANTRLNSTRQELEFKSKMSQRAFAQRQNELIRGYEKKLTDQKVEFDAQLHDVTAQSEQRIREVERRSKQTVEEQGRAYEQRIAQSAQQHQERERLVTSNYEEEMDKIRRSNALLIRKKS